MKNLIITFLLLISGAFISYAESTVYIFVPSLNNENIELSVNGNRICDMNAPIKKTMDGNGMFQIPFKVAYMGGKTKRALG